MKFSIAAVLLALAAGSSLVMAEERSFRTDYLPVGSVRTDPIISQTCLSDHVHTFYGPQIGMFPKVTHADLINSSINTNSGNVVENKSAYWHPAVYEVVNGVYNLVESDDTTAYYIWESTDDTRAFPPGFRMIGGLRPDVDPVETFAGCAGERPCTKSDCSSPNTFFPTVQCDELEVEMSFPNCWDGENIDSDSHTSHVHYSSDGTASGSCPSTHPYKIPLISLFFRINNYKGGHYTFSDDSSIFHADYIAGWDQQVLQNVINNCQESTFETESQDSCRDFLSYRTNALASFNPDTAFQDLLAEVAALQPDPPLDTRETIAPELITGISSPPRGSCSGTLITDGGSAGPTPAPPGVTTTQNPPVVTTTSTSAGSSNGCTSQCDTLYNQCISVERDWCSMEENGCLEGCSEEFEVGEIDEEELTECNNFCETDFLNCMSEIVTWCQQNRAECTSDCPTSGTATEPTQGATEPTQGATTTESSGGGGSVNTPSTDMPAGEEGAIQKMCLFYDNPSGHARVDPILDPDRSSGHVHTFYGPQNFHPGTTNADLVATKPQFSSSPWIENQSLYWHPSIYRVTQQNGQDVYTRVNDLFTSPYYRWNRDTFPETVEFPQGFRMIAFSDEPNANKGGEAGENLFVECCDGEECETTTGNPLIFPTRSCGVLGIAFAMPTCWDTSKGIGTEDPFAHVAYTLDGTVSGPCPAGYDKRIPQVQLFVRIQNYQGGTYQLADGRDVFHVDFMNGWQKDKLDQIIAGCDKSGIEGDNPDCDCERFLTENTTPSETVCDSDVKNYILNEETALVTGSLPFGAGSGSIIPKSWDVDPPFVCDPNPPPVQITTTTTLRGSSTTTQGTTTASKAPVTTTEEEVTSTEEETTTEEQVTTTEEETTTEEVTTTPTTTSTTTTTTTEEPPVANECVANCDAEFTLCFSEEEEWCAFDRNLCRDECNEWFAEGEINRKERRQCRANCNAEHDECMEINFQKYLSEPIAWLAM